MQKTCSSRRDPGPATAAKKEVVKRTAAVSKLEQKAVDQVGQMLLSLCCLWGGI